MTAHEQFMELAAAAIDFDLTHAERDELGRHLDSCVLCRRRLVAIQADARAIANLPLIAVPAHMHARARARALGRRSPRSALGLSRTLVLAAALALLALIGIAVAGGMLRRSDHQQLVDARSPEPSASLEPSAVAPTFLLPAESYEPYLAVASSLCGHVEAPAFYVGSESIRRSARPSRSPVRRLRRPTSRSAS